MRIIPDFAAQIVEIEKGISGQAELSATSWKDDVQKRYYSTFIDQYFKDIGIFINGGLEIVSKGLNDLLVFIDDKLSEMEQVTGVPADVSFSIAAIDNYKGGTIVDNWGDEVDVEGSSRVRERGGVVHNSKLERDYWERKNGPDPGNMNPGDVNDIMDERNK